MKEQQQPSNKNTIKAPNISFPKDRGAIKSIEESFRLININKLLSKSMGSRNVSIGIIDGPIDLTHPKLKSAKIESVKNRSNASCLSTKSIACIHGTFITGMLCSERNDDTIALCPNCSFLLYPIFCENGVEGQVCPLISSQNLAEAIIDTVNAGANIINMSLGLESGAIQKHEALYDAFDYAYKNNVILVGASGNQGRIGHTPLFKHKWIIPVSACDNNGIPIPQSNLGVTIGRNGLLSPGKNIKSLASGGDFTQMTGTSVAAPFVTGAIALLLSLYPEATARQIHRAILLPGITRNNIIPPILNPDLSMQILERELNYELNPQKI